MKKEECKITNDMVYNLDEIRSEVDRLSELGNEWHMERVRARQFRIGLLQLTFLIGGLILVLAGFISLLNQLSFVGCIGAITIFTLGVIFMVFMTDAERLEQHIW